MNKLLTKPFMQGRKNNGVKWEPPASCVLWLPGQDDAPSTTIRDRSGFGNHGTITGATWERLPGGAIANKFTAIDCGSSVVSREGGFSNGYTVIDLANPANATGNLDGVDVWARNNVTSLQVGTFYLVSGVTYKCRASVTLGAVTAGSLQRFTGLTLPVVAGDFIGYYANTGGIEYTGSAGSGVYYYLGESIDAGDQNDYTAAAGYAISLQGFGGDGINCGNGASLNLTTGITLATWLCPSLLQARKDFIAKWDAADKSYAIELGDAGSDIMFFLRKGDDSDEVSIQTGAGELELNKWKFIVATCDNSKQRIYVNGVQKAIGDYNFDIHVSAANLFLGAIPWANHYYSGMMDFTRILGSAWSASQVVSTFQSERHLLSA